jgi:hypothetical protein
MLFQALQFISPLAAYRNLTIPILSQLMVAFASERSLLITTDIDNHGQKLSRSILQDIESSKVASMYHPMTSLVCCEIHASHLPQCDSPGALVS